MKKIFAILMLITIISGCSHIETSATCYGKIITPDQDYFYEQLDECAELVCSSWGLNASGAQSWYEYEIHCTKKGAYGHISIRNNHYSNACSYLIDKQFKLHDCIGD